MSVWYIKVPWSTKKAGEAIVEKKKNGYHKKVQATMIQHFMCTYLGHTYMQDIWSNLWLGGLSTDNSNTNANDNDDNSWLHAHG